MERLFEILQEYVLLLIGMVIGSMLRIMQYIKSTGKGLSRFDRWYQFIVSLGLMFVSVLTCDYLELDARLSAGIGFISCYAGVALLDVIKNALLNRIKNEIGKTEKS